MIIKYPDPILSKPIANFDFDYPPISPSDLSIQLLKEMTKTYGCGLSSNQLGLPFGVFVIRGYPENLVCFNHKIVYYSDNIISMEEACLSFPGMIIKVKRPSEIRARFQTPSGMVVTKKFEGLTARCYQHELDHMNGIRFTNHVKPLALEMAKKQQKKLIKKIMRLHKKI